MRRRNWEILDKWVWHVADDMKGGAVYRWTVDRKQTFPGCQVRTFRRRVRAGGAALEVVVGVVRREKRDHGTAADPKPVSYVLPEV